MAEKLATEYLHVRLTEQMMEKLSKMADDERRTLSLMARILLEEAFAGRSKNGKK